MTAFLRHRTDRLRSHEHVISYTTGFLEAVKVFVPYKYFKEFENNFNAAILDAYNYINNYYDISD